MKEESGFEEPQPSTSTAEDVKDVKIEPSLENGPKQEVEDEENGDAQDQKPVKSEDDEEEEGEESEIEETHLDASLLYQEPVYAEVCSFFNLFGALMGMKPISFSRIDKMFCTFHNGQVDTELIDLHIQLMRKIYLKSARADKWEQSLLKFCSVCPSLESELLELERYNYVDLPLSVKLSVLKALCESQFDCNVKFKENIFNTYQTGEMRLAPIGVDKHGLSYYYQQDYELNIRVYTVEPDDMSGGTWTLRAKSKNELLFLIDSLKSPDFGKKQDSKEDDEDIDEDQIVNQNAKHADKHGDAASKSEIDIKPAPPALEMSEEQKREVQMTTKRFTFWDLYQDGSHLNKKKAEKEARKKEKLSSANNTVIKEKSKTPADEDEERDSDRSGEEKEEEEHKEDEEPVDPELQESLLAIAGQERRIMPRRSARNTAISNLKAFTATPKKAAAMSAEKAKNSAHTSKNNKPFKSEYMDSDHMADSSDEEEIFDEEDDEEEEENSSDEEFNPDGSRKTLPSQNVKTRRGKKPKQRQPNKTLKRNAASKAKKKVTTIPTKSGKLKAPEISFVDEDSSDEEEVPEDKKERKKATEKTLCMQCRGSKRPDLLLLCDMCDDAWHTWCLKPSLWYVPDGDWYCPKCHHKMLIQKLTFAAIKLAESLKSRHAEQKKKQTMADRLKREMEYIGVSLNNIIPSNAPIVKNGDITSDEDEEEDDIDDGQRKSKRRALKRVMGKTARRERQLELQERYYGPIITIAEGRTRRQTKQVDYKFSAFDEQIQEAMESIDSSAKIKDEPVSGLGRGKDMANIIEADRKRKASVDTSNSENNAPIIKNAIGQPPTKRLSDTKEEDGEDEKKAPPKKKQKKKLHKRLTDLDEASESDETDEYQASGASAMSDEPEPSEDEYLPGEFRRSGRSTRGGRRKSDEEFIDDESSSSDYEIGAKRRGSRNKKLTAAAGKFFGWKGGKKSKGRAGGRKGGRRKPWESDEDETPEESEEFQGESSDSDRKKSKKKGRNSGGKGVQSTSRKWGPKASSNSEEDEDEEELEVPSGSSDEEKTETGRPLRKAAVEMKKKIKEIDKTFKELDDEQEDEEEDAGEGDEKSTSNKSKNARPVGALTRQNPPSRVIGSDDEEEDEFRPSEESEEEEEEEDEADEKVENEEGSANEEELPDDDEDEEPPTLVKTATTATKPYVEKRNEKVDGDCKMTEGQGTSTPTKTKQANKEEKKAPFLDNIPKVKSEENDPGQKRDMSVKGQTKANGAKAKGGSSESTSLDSEHEPTASTSSSATQKSSLTAVKSESEVPKVPPRSQERRPSKTSTPSTPTAVSSPASTSSTQSKTGPQKALARRSSNQSVAATSSPAHNGAASSPHQMVPMQSPPPQPYHSLGPVSTTPSLSHAPLSAGQPPPQVAYSNFYSMHSMPKASLPTQPFMGSPPPAVSSMGYVAYPPQQQYPPVSMHPRQHYGQPPAVYQTLSPYGGPIPQQAMVDPRTGAIVAMDPDSLGHALAGAMNPEDL